MPQASARERAAAARRGKPASVPARGRFRTEPVRSKGEQAAAEALAGRTHADWVAEQITERTEAARRAASVTGAPKATGTSGATGTPATTRASATTGTSAVAGASTTTGGEPEAGTAAGIGSAAGTAAGAGALKVTWAPDALAAFAVAVLPVVAAFLA